MDEHIEDLFPFYALGAISAEEKAAVDAYVQAHPEAQARLEAAIATSDKLAHMAEPMSPSASVRRNVMAYARRHPHATAVPEPAPTATTPGETAPGPTLAWWQRWRQDMVAPIFAGLAAVTAVLLFIWTLSLQNSITTLQNQVATLQQALHERDTILALLPSGHGIPIMGTEHQPDAAGQLVVAPDGVTAVLAVANLSPLPAGQTYQLWLIGDEGPVSEGVFTVDAAGLGLLEVMAETAVFAHNAIGISIEPEGGSPQPTGAIVMLSEIFPLDSES